VLEISQTGLTTFYYIYITKLTRTWQWTIIVALCNLFMSEQHWGPSKHWVMDSTKFMSNEKITHYCTGFTGYPRVAPKPMRFAGACTGKNRRGYWVCRYVVRVGLATRYHNPCATLVAQPPCFCCMMVQVWIPGRHCQLLLEHHLKIPEVLFLLFFGFGLNGFKSHTGALLAKVFPGHVCCKWAH